MARWWQDSTREGRRLRGAATTPTRGHKHTQTWTSQPQAQRDWNGTAMGWRCFCTCELEVITCSAVAVGLVVITFVHQVPVGSGRSSCRCCNKIRGLASLTWARAHRALARESADAFAETSNPWWEARLASLTGAKYPWIWQNALGTALFWYLIRICQESWQPSHFIHCYLHKHPFSEKCLNSLTGYLFMTLELRTLMTEILLRLLLLLFSMC